MACLRGWRASVGRVLALVVCLREWCGWRACVGDVLAWVAWVAWVAC